MRLVPGGDAIIIPEGLQGRRRRLVVLLICSSSLFIVYLEHYHAK